MWFIAAALALFVLLFGFPSVPFTPVEPSPVVPTVEEPEPSLDDPVEPIGGPTQCSDADAEAGGLARRLSPIDAALGARHLFLEIGNCGTEPLPLDEVHFTGLDADGSGGELSLEVLGDAPVLAPGEWTGLTLDWRTNGRCERGAQRLVLHAGEAAVDVSSECMQLGGEYAAERDATLTLTWPTT